MSTKIFILDKIRDEINFFRDLLEKEGYQVISRDDDYKLLNMIEHDNNPPDLILINAQIHHADSYLICKEVKLLEKGQNIPIIFINRDERYFDPEIMLNSGGSDYINYPFCKAEVLHRIKTQLKVKNLEAQLEEKDRQLHKIIPHYQRLQKALENAKKDLEKGVNLDPITRLTKHDHFEKVLNQEWLRSSRQRVSNSDLAGTNISLIISKINDFKEYQESYGQQLTENCLMMVAEAIKNTVKRPADLVAFYDNEKFAVLLPNTDEEGAERVAHLISENIQQLQIPHHYSTINDYITLSMGVATGIPTQALPAIILIEVAEKALEQALEKHQEESIIIDSF